MPPLRPLGRDYPLILASASPRRRALLRQVGLPFRTVPSRLAEDGAAGEPAAVACALATAKARDVGRSRRRWVLGADTVVVIDDCILGKPRDAVHATDMLQRLSGREHTVITGFTVLYPAATTAHVEAVDTRVRFKPLAPDEIRAYVATGEPFGKAGGYAIQGIGAFLVEAIAGSYTNVVGLPVCALIKALRSVGALEGFPVAPAYSGRLQTPAGPAARGPGRTA